MIKITLDNVNFTCKPDKKATTAITQRIAGLIQELPIETIAEQLVQPYGKTFTPAVFKDNKRTNDTWVSQQLFGLDFDEGITVSEVLDRCKKYQIEPCFIYSTFSSVDNNKFRVFFCNDTVVTDYRIRTVIQLGLMRLFKESDKSCKDGSRLFYGGQQLIYTDYNAVINPVALVRELCRYIQDIDKAHAAREIKGYCQSVGLDMLNGMPKIVPQSEIADTEEVNGGVLQVLPVVEEIMKFGEIGCSPINTIYIGCHAKSPKIAYYFYFSKDNNRTIGNFKPHPKFSIENEKQDRELIERFDFTELEKNCKLYRSFITGEYWAYHNELMGLCTNLLCVKGGRDKFFLGLEQGDYDIGKWQFYSNYFVKMNYAPMQCNNFCPHAAECEHSRNIIDQIKLPRGTVRILDMPKLKPLEQAERELREHMEKALAAKDTKVYVIKAPTGIGKTEAYSTLENVTIALPTHKLKDEVSKRMKVSFVATPKLPEDEYLKYLYSIGSYMLANQHIQKMANEGHEEFIQYLNDLQVTDTYRGTILTTHDKLLSLKLVNDTIIIDEDIISTLLPLNTTTLDDINTMAEQCFYFDSKHVLDSIRKFAESASDGLVYAMPSFGGVKTSKLEHLVSENKINSNVLGFLNCEHFVKYTSEDGKVFFYYINKRELPYKKKIIMLSATANEEICRLMFGDRLVFVDIGNVETKGDIQQYPQRSFSRYQFDDNLKKIAKALTKDAPVITYKEHKDEFNTVATFGATEGIDAFKGQDIAVIGTPHVNPTVYLLFANALGKKPKLNDCRTTMQYTKIKRNGFEFYFNTFSNDDILQEIQLYLIESELIQAVGRARILRNNCTVTVLSNLPLQGAEFKYLTKKELEMILA